MRDDENYFIFAGRKSTEFGVWCSGSETWGAPERDIEQVSIPGRNGDLQIDNGRFKNKDVPYACFMMREDCLQKIDDFRSWLMSLSDGYYRLEDPYHPNEYRMARVKAGFEPTMGPYNANAKFTLTFDCKPQRFYKETVEEFYFPLAKSASGGASTLMMDYDKIVKFAIKCTTKTAVAIDCVGTYGTSDDDDYEVAYDGTWLKLTIGTEMTDIKQLLEARKIRDQLAKDQGAGGTLQKLRIRVSAIPVGSELEIIYDDISDHVIIGADGAEKIVNNISLFPSRPLVIAEIDTSSKYATFTLNGQNFKIGPFNGNQTSVYVDYDTMDAYTMDASGSVVSANNKTVVTENGKVAPIWNDFKPERNRISIAYLQMVTEIKKTANTRPFLSIDYRGYTI